MYSILWEDGNWAILPSFPVLSLLDFRCECGIIMVKKNVLAYIRKGGAYCPAAYVTGRQSCKT